MRASVPAPAGETCPAGSVAMEGPWQDSGPESTCVRQRRVPRSARALGFGECFVTAWTPGFSLLGLGHHSRTPAPQAMSEPGQPPSLPPSLLRVSTPVFCPWRKWSPAGVFFKVGLTYAVLCPWDFFPLSVCLRRDGTVAFTVLSGLRGPLWRLGSEHLVECCLPAWVPLCHLFMGAALWPE